MSVTSTAIAKLCYKTRSKNFAIQYFLTINSRLDPNMLIYNFLLPFSPFSNLCVKGQHQLFWKTFLRKSFFCTTTWFLTLGHAKSLTFSTVSDNFQYFALFPVFLLLLKFGFFFFNTVRIQTTYSYNIWLKAKLGHTLFLGLGLKSCW